MHSSWKSRWGSLGFFGKFFWGGYLGLWKNQGGVVFYCIFMWKFFKNLYREYMRWPPSPPPFPRVQLWPKLTLKAFPALPTCMIRVRQKIAESWNRVDEGVLPLWGDPPSWCAGLKTNPALYAVYIRIMFSVFPRTSPFRVITLSDLHCTCHH